MNDSVNFKIPHFFPMEMIFGTSKIDKITTEMDVQGRHSNQCHRAMALVVFCLASKPCFKNLPRNYNTLKYIAKKPRGLEVALVDFLTRLVPLSIH